jgi:hypothetical protein
MSEVLVIEVGVGVEVGVVGVQAGEIVLVGTGPEGQA